MEEFQEGIEDERKDGFGGIGEPDGVPDEMETSTFGLTKQELKNRLKYIAGLCYALSCDITSVEIEADYLRDENRYLRKRLEKLGEKMPPPPKSLQGLMSRVQRKRNLSKKENPKNETKEE